MNPYASKRIEAIKRRIEQLKKPTGLLIRFLANPCRTMLDSIGEREHYEAEKLKMNFNWYKKGKV